MKIKLKDQPDGKVYEVIREDARWYVVRDPRVRLYDNEIVIGKHYAEEVPE